VVDEIGEDFLFWGQIFRSFVLIKEVHKLAVLLRKQIGSFSV
jgi:hypothetical protein